MAALAPPAEARLALARVDTFRVPTYLTAPPGDVRRLFVTEKRGVVRVVRDGRKLARPFLDLSRRVGANGEGGLLSLAFAPDYARSRRFYVYFTDRGGGIAVDSYLTSRGSPDRALASSRRTILRQAHRTNNHKGGLVTFGPDGRLYVGLGDGGPQRDPEQRGQDLRTRLGKILRIAPRPRGGYGIPADNPFARRRGVRREIWAYGVRNPWRFAFTPRGGFVLGDVGQNAIEEIDYVQTTRPGRPPRGGYNFGWSVFEGRRRFRPGAAPRHVPPVLEKRHSSGFCSVIGGFVARDRSLGSLRGRYVYGDFCSQRLRSVAFTGGRARGDRPLPLRVPRLISFGEDASGRLYATSIQGGVFRLVNRPG